MYRDLASGRLAFIEFARIRNQSGALQLDRACGREESGTDVAEAVSVLFHGHRWFQPQFVGLEQIMCARRVHTEQYHDRHRSRYVKLNVVT